MKIFIAGSSHDDIPKKYIKLADTISELLSTNNNTLILGGIPSTIPNNSMMGKYNNNFNNKKFITVTKYADTLDDNESQNSIVLESTMDRTKTIYKEADLILFLPGGIGTLAEIASCLEEVRTYKTTKKILLYNYEGFFDDIINWLDNGIKNNFINKSDIEKYIVINNKEELIKEMEILIWKI